MIILTDEELDFLAEVLRRVRLFIPEDVQDVYQTVVEKINARPK